MDHGKAILGPIQPDLTGEKVLTKKMYPHIDSGNFKAEKETDQFFRKAVDSFTHDQLPEGKVNDPKHYKLSIPMESRNQNGQTKGGVSTDYLKHIIDTNNIPLSR